MKSKPHPDYVLMTGISGVFALVYLGGLLWAALLLLMQVLGWIRFGEWQSLPLYALFVTEGAQSSIRLFGSGVQPLSIVPAWGFSESGLDLAWRLSGQLVGAAKILTWVLETSLVFWLVVVSFLSLVLAVSAKADSTALVEVSGNERRTG